MVYKCVYMCKINVLIGFVLGFCMVEQVEDVLMVFWVDVMVIVVDFEDCVVEFGVFVYFDFVGDVVFQVFDGVVDEIGEDLFECEVVVYDVGQWFDLDFGLGF